MNLRPRTFTPSSRNAYAAIALIAWLVAACTHRDVPNCFAAEGQTARPGAIEQVALEDAHRREDPCGGATTQCGFSASTLPSGEVIVTVQLAFVREDDPKCVFGVDAARHYLYSSSGTFKEKMPSP